MKTMTIYDTHQAVGPVSRTVILLSIVLSLCTGRVQAFPAELLNPDLHLPPNQAIQAGAELLAGNIANALTTALNSNDDKITLKIARNIEFPIPIPGVPPGIFNGGVSTSVTPEIKRVVDARSGISYYEVSFERQQGLSFGASLPDMPKNTDASAKASMAISSKDVFRFNTPADVATGILDYILLKGLWQQMQPFQAMGIDLHNVADFSQAVRSYFATLTGIDFAISRDEAIKTLHLAEVSLHLAQFAIGPVNQALTDTTGVYNVAARIYTAAQQRLSSAQRRYYEARASLNACVNFCTAKRLALDSATVALTTARNLAQRSLAALTTAKTALATAQARLVEANLKLDQARSALMQAQRQLAMLPADASVDPFSVVLNGIVDGVDMLNRSYQGYEAVFTKGLALDAQAACLAAVGINAARAFKIANNSLDNTVTVEFSFIRDLSANFDVPTSVQESNVAFKRSTGINYKLVFALNDASQRYELQDQGTLKINAGLDLTQSGGVGFCSSPITFGVDVMAGVAVLPELEFKPGEQVMAFAGNLQGVINLTPVVDIVQGFPQINPHDLVNAVGSTVASFDNDTLIAALAQVRPLPLKISFLRTTGLQAKISGGSDKILKGGVSLSAIWTDNGNPVDLTGMTVADFVASAVDGSVDLAAFIERLTVITADAYQELDAAF